VTADQDTAEAYPNRYASDTVTITISRATAERWITEAYDTTDRKAVLVELAIRAALEGER